jgi:hypothetical protein
MDNQSVLTLTTPPLSADFCLMLKTRSEHLAL